MFKRGIRLPFNLLGIPVMLDWSFLLILPLLAFIIGNRVELFAEMFDLPKSPILTQGWMPYTLGLIAAIGLFAGVILHELGHAVTARLYGVKVRGINLWFLGGIAQFEQMPRQRGAEAVVAIVGPLVSLALAGVCWLVLQIVPATAVPTRFVFEYLTYMNIVLAVFNMIPALPLDGGRVLRSLLALGMPHLRATQIAGVISRAFAIFIGLLGLISFNFFLLLIAGFIYLAVTAETRSSQIEEMLRGVSVRQLMNRDVKVVPPEMRIAELMQRMITDHHLGFPVVDADQRVRGMISIEQVHQVDPETPVGKVMSVNTPVLREEDDAVEAFRKMVQNGFGRLIVTDANERLVGIISKTDLIRLIQLRSISPDITIALDDSGYSMLPKASDARLTMSEPT